jgi:hypothetical protein
VQCSDAEIVNPGKRFSVLPVGKLCIPCRLFPGTTKTEQDLDLFCMLFLLFANASVYVYTRLLRRRKQMFSVKRKNNRERPQSGVVTPLAMWHEDCS